MTRDAGTSKFFTHTIYFIYTECFISAESACDYENLTLPIIPAEDTQITHIFSEYGKYGFWSGHLLGIYSRSNEDEHLLNLTTVVSEDEQYFTICTDLRDKRKL